MRTLEQVKEMVTNWHRNDTVGTFMVYRYPGAKVLEVIEEIVVKYDEMPDDVKDAFALLVNHYGIERGEIFRNNKTGKPDRVKFTRRADV